VDKMNERIAKLREQSLNAKASLTHERAVLITEFYKIGISNKVSIPVGRALAFKYILSKKELCINEGELIVGERGPQPKATPTYPEICAHSLEDLEIMNTREKITFKIQDETKEIYKETIIPFWKGRSIRDRIFDVVDEDWKLAYQAGVFTEFMEQRAPGHTVADNKIFKKGFVYFKAQINKSLEELDFYNDPKAYEKQEELEAMEIAADAIIIFAKRYSEKAQILAKDEEDSIRRKELVDISLICEKVPANAPETFREALQHYWFIHLGVITELNTWDSFNPGRLDQHLYPFYKKEIENGTLTEEGARELLQAFWIKFNNQPAPPKVGITAQESNTYTDFCLINIGGVKENGEDGVNDLSYLILDVIEEMRILQPSSMVQISNKTPDKLLKRALEIVKTGFGQPSIFNTDALIQEMVRQGKNIKDARNGGASGCVEVGAFGKESYILTGYFNLVKILEITLNNGLDPITGEQIGLKTGNVNDFKTFEELLEKFKEQVIYFVNIKIKGNNIVERLYATYLPSPFLSIIIDDCIEKGKDYNDGGARYNTSYIQGVGLGTLTDSLSAIKYNIFDKKTMLMTELLDAIETDFEKSEQLHYKLVEESPKYGNDNDYADDIMKQAFNIYFNAIDNRPNTKGGK